MNRLGRKESWRLICGRAFCSGICLRVLSWRTDWTVGNAVGEYWQQRYLEIAKVHKEQQMTVLFSPNGLRARLGSQLHSSTVSSGTILVISWRLQAQLLLQTSGNYEYLSCLDVCEMDLYGGARRCREVHKSTQESRSTQFSINRKRNTMKIFYYKWNESD